jgi:hypothetical protein
MGFLLDTRVLQLIFLHGSGMVRVLGYEQVNVWARTRVQLDPFNRF